MDSDQELSHIVHSLEICAETAGDIVPAVFRRFFASDKDAYELMKHSDEHMQGRMMESVFELLMSDEHFGEGQYLDWEIENHIDAYAVTPPMYQSFFTSLVAEVRTAVGEAWNDTINEAWDARIKRVMKQVHQHP